jgi:hypothetical protein
VNAWRRLQAWAVRWQTTLVLLAVTAVFVLSLWGLASQNRNAREADLRFCQSSNERTKVIVEFIYAATADPDPRQYDFIADPVLRAGALEQARKGRAAQRKRAAETFTLRDCEAEYPPP